MRKLVLYVVRPEAKNLVQNGTRHRPKSVTDNRISVKTRIT